jgi:hypothetical protein
VAFLLVARHALGKLAGVEISSAAEDLVLHVGPGLAALVVLGLCRVHHVRTITFFGSSRRRSLAFFMLPLITLAIVYSPLVGFVETLTAADRTRLMALLTGHGEAGTG